MTLLCVTYLCRAGPRKTRPSQMSLRNHASTSRAPYTLSNTLWRDGQELRTLIPSNPEEALSPESLSQRTTQPVH